tara:strand:- start:396 stop:1868 length:1473 start_codon:yes stop_codon:yes gene_type:complete
MANIDWRKLGNYRPDGDMYLMNVFHAIWMSKKIECEKGEAVLFADIKEFPDFLDDCEAVFNDEMVFDDPKDKNGFKQKYSGKKCLRAVYTSNQTDEPITLTKIKKTDAFGGGTGGSGAGAKATEMFESAACWVTAVRFSMGNKNLASDWGCTNCAFDPVKDKVKTSATMQEVCKFLQNNPKWLNTSISTANTLYSVYKGGDYKFYRGEGIVEGIEEHFKGVNRTAKNTEGDFGFSNLNKWTPADIYLCDRQSERNMLRDIKKKKTFATLNPLIETYLDSKSLVGISLKALKPDSSGTLEQYNKTGAAKETKTFDGAGMKPGSPGLLNSMDVYIFGVEKGIQFRATDTAGKTWQGEIIGGAAKHGKLGGGVLSQIMNEVYKKPFLGSNGYSGYATVKAAAAASKTPAGQQEMADEISRIAIAHNVSDDAEDVSVASIKRKGPKWLFSKYLGMKMVEAIYSKGNSKRNEITTAIYRYASSQSDNSATFMKIS